MRHRTTVTRELCDLIEGAYKRGEKNSMISRNYNVHRNTVSCIISSIILRTPFRTREDDFARAVASRNSVPTIEDQTLLDCINERSDVVLKDLSDCVLEETGITLSTALFLDG